MKKLLYTTIAAAVIAAPVTSVSANLYLNGAQVDALFYEDGAAKLGVRSFFEAAGYTIQWFDESLRVAAYDSEHTISMYAEKNYVFLYKTGFVTDDSVTFSDDGSLIMPLEAAQKSLNANIEFKNGDIYITSDMVHDQTGWEYEVLELTNKQRAEHGLDALIWNQDLAAAAEEHCIDMAERDYFDHKTPEGLSPFDRMKKLGITYIYAAENIAAGQPDPQSVVNAWMNSPNHRKNILNKNLKEVGIAYSRGGAYGIYWAQEFSTYK